MLLITMAHRGEAEILLQETRAATLEAPFPVFTAEKFLIAITGEGERAGMTALLAMERFRPAEVLNLGLAGSLREEEPGSVRQIRTVYGETSDGIAKTAFTLQTAEKLFPAADCISAARRVTSTEYRNHLAVFASCADRELYSIAAAASLVGLPLRSVKLISDAADETTDTAAVRSHTDFSRRLAEIAFQMAELPLPEPEKRSAAPLLPEEFLLSRSQQRQLEKLVEAIAVRTGKKQSAILEEAGLYFISQSGMKPKDRTAHLIRNLEELHNPFLRNLREKLEKEIVPLQNSRASLTFSRHFESPETELRAAIRSREDWAGLMRAMEKVDYNRIESLLNGDPNAV